MCSVVQVSVQLSVSSLAILVVMIWQWRSLHLIHDSIDSRKIVRQDVDAWVVDMSVMSSFRTKRSWSEAGWLENGGGVVLHEAWLVIQNFHAVCSRNTPAEYNK